MLNPREQTVLLSRLLLLCLSLHSSLAPAEWIKSSEAIMGTVVTLEFWSEDPKQAPRITDAVMDMMRGVDKQLSPYISSSELYRVNAEAFSHPVKISNNFVGLLEKSRYYSELSDGAFDITFASVGHLYDYREGVAPADKTIAETLDAIDYRHVILDKENSTVRFAQANVKIDLGGIAKGYAVDQAIDILSGFGVTSAIVSAGGDTRMLGNRRGEPWIIGIQHPRKKGEFAVRIPLEDSAISTSGDYERYFLDGEIRIHHIINPSSGKSADQVESVSILAPMAIDSDALSTTVFVLGVREGLALVNRLEGVDAIIIDGKTRMHYSDGLLRADP